MKAAIGMMVLSLGLAACQTKTEVTSEHAPKGAKPEPKYETVVAATDVKVMTLTAEISLPTEAVLGLSLPAQASILEWQVAVGQHVEAQTPLAVVQLPEMADLEASQREAAQVVRARQQALAQERKALAAGLSDMSSVQALEVALSEAKARQEAAGRSLAARSTLTKADNGQGWIWKSPVAGRVEGLTCALGTPVSEGERCVQLLDEALVVVRAHVPEQILSQVQNPSLYASLTLAGQTQSWPLELWRWAPRLELKSRTLLAEFKSKGAPLAEPGRSGRVDLMVKAEEGALLVPEAALTRLEGKDVVFAKDQGPLVVERLGRAAEGIVVKSEGLSAGTLVATDELFGLKSLHLIGEGGDE